MKKLLLILLCLPIICIGQCISGDCENGQGTFTWSSGSKYVGSFIDGMRTGEGTYSWANGDKYIGVFIDGKRTGQGTFTWPSGSKYIGVFIDGKRTGHGTYAWANGNKYVGSFIDGERTGEGTFTWPSGSKYIGVFIDGIRRGFGTLTWVNGNKYVGVFIDNKRTGKGTFTWASGDKYVGAFIDDERTGQGTYAWASGSKYVGEYKAGKRHGQGTYTSNGEVQEGIWENNKYIRKNMPYKLSKGIIDHRLFTFIKSTNFMGDGRKYLKEMIQNGVTLDASLIEDMDGFPSCGCCDQSAFEIADMFYFNDGGVLIIERYYAGDWESSEANWYEFFIYSTEKNKFERKLRLQKDHLFAYNYRTGYIIDKEINPCGYDFSYRIYNNKFEDLGIFSPDPLRIENVDFYWNEKDNEVIFKREKGNIVLDIDKFSER